MKFWDNECSEAMFRYIGYSERDFDKFCSFLEFSNISIAEYIHMYCLEDFVKYCDEVLNITIEKE